MYGPNGTNSNIDPTVGFIAAVVTGGTASVIGGGKFANGAQTAAMGYLYNHLGVLLRGAQLVQQAWGRLQMLVAPHAETALSIIEAGAYALSGTPSPTSAVLSVYGNSASRLIHVFDDATHELAPLISQHGTAENAFAAVHNAAQQLPGQRGVVNMWIKVSDVPVWVQGKTIDGIFRVSPFSANQYHPRYPYPLAIPR